MSLFVMHPPFFVMCPPQSCCVMHQCIMNKKVPLRDHKRHTSYAPCLQVHFQGPKKFSGGGEGYTCPTPPPTGPDTIQVPPPPRPELAPDRYPPSDLLTSGDKIWNYRSPQLTDKLKTLSSLTLLRVGSKNVTHYKNS